TYNARTVKGASFIWEAGPLCQPCPAQGSVLIWALAILFCYLGLLSLIGTLTRWRPTAITKWPSGSVGSSNEYVNPDIVDPPAARLIACPSANNALYPSSFLAAIARPLAAADLSVIPRARVSTWLSPLLGNGWIRTFHLAPSGPRERY